MRATGGLTVRHGSCWTASVRAHHSIPAAMCWGSSAVAENTAHVRATRPDATTTISASPPPAAPSESGPGETRRHGSTRRP